jgi:outer membrane protein, heavy metal efflux system
LNVKQPYSLFLLSLALAAGSVPALGQAHLGDHPSALAPITTEEAIQIALRDNPEIRTASREVSTAQARSMTAGSRDDPMFQYRDWGTPLKQPWDLNQAQNMFMIQQTFQRKDKRALRTTLAGDEVQMASAEMEKTRQDVAAAVRKACIDLLRNADEMRLHDSEATLMHEALAVAMAKYTVGKVPQADVLRAQIVLTRLKEHMLQLEEERDTARAELNTLMGIDAANPTEVLGVYRSPATLPSAAELERIAIAHRPELAAIRQQMTSNQDQVKLARLAYQPDYTVGLGYMVMPSGSPFRNAYMAELSIDLPWLNRQRHDGEVRQAATAIDLRHAEMDAQQSRARLEIQQALTRVLTAQKRLVLYRDTLKPQAEATFHASVAAYQNDRTEFLNLIDSQNLLLDIQTATFKAAADMDTGLADLERAIGAPLPGSTADTPNATQGESK